MDARVGWMGAAADNSSSGQVPDSPDVEDTDEVDEWGEESFPASDPPSGWSGPEES
jgi:hypothetical protein